MNCCAIFCKWVGPMVCVCVVGVFEGWKVAQLLTWKSPCWNELGTQGTNLGVCVYRRLHVCLINSHDLFNEVLVRKWLCKVLRGWWKVHSSFCQSQRGARCWQRETLKTNKKKKNFDIIFSGFKKMKQQNFQAGLFFPVFFLSGFCIGSTVHWGHSATF